MSANAERLTADKAFMRRAIALAGAGRGRVEPNPVVGAVLVKGGRVIAEGAHLEYGGPHAEALALARAGRRAAGATLYITLEPCDHFGKTPPCTRRILRARLARVVVGARDPNPQVRGRGLARLRRAGIATASGVLEREARSLNPLYNSRMAVRELRVAIKAAQSLDGKIAAVSGGSRWISGPAARRFAHGLRASSGAVIVGVNTVLRDDPRLGVRLPGFRGCQPFKVVLDGRLRTPLGARLFAGAPPETVILATTAAAARSRGVRYRKKAQVWILPARAGRIDLKALTRRLAARGIRSALIEGGGETLASALVAGIVREGYFILAPILIGGRAATPVIGGPGARELAQATRLRRWEWRRLGKDLLIHGIF